MTIGLSPPYFLLNDEYISRVSGGLVVSFSGWDIVVNGRQGELVVGSVSPNGTIEGNVFGQELTGIFDNSTGRIAFVSQNNSSYEVYNGYIADVTFSRDLGDQHFEEHIITGTAEKLQPGPNNVHGWYANATFSCAPC
jgi:hypothetical protein